MAKIQNVTNLYTPNTIIVDAAGTTPFTTVAAGITAAVGLGVSNPTVYIRSGTYAESLVLVDGVNLQGSDPATTIISGVHTIPATGTLEISNITLALPAPFAAIFTEGATGNCAITISNCIFSVVSAAIFNLPTSIGALLINNCRDKSGSNWLINFGVCSLTIENSNVGTPGVVAQVSGPFYVYNSTVQCPIRVYATGTANIVNSRISKGIDLRDTSTAYISNTLIDSGVAVAVKVAAGCAATLSNVVIDSSYVNCIQGAGSITLGEVTFLDDSGVTVTTQDYTTKVTTGVLQLDKANTGVCRINAGLVTPTAMTDGQLLIGSTGNMPSAATLTAGSGVSITNAAGAITVASTAPFAWTTVNADGTIANNTGRINIKAGALLTMTLPATASVGTVIILQGSAAGNTGWKLAQNAGQNVQLGSTSTTIGAGGSLASTNNNDSITLVCTVADTTWNAVSVIGNITIV